jgi:hypothetical protein
MSQPATIGADKATSLADLNTIVGQYEGMLGPLISLGNDGNRTTLTYDTDQPAPAKAAVLAIDQNGQSATPAGSTMVCQGTVFVASALTHVTATRPN